MKQNTLSAFSIVMYCPHTFAAVLQLHISKQCSHPGEMRAHREILNAPLLPRSCAKCCFGCFPAIDRSLAAGGEMAAGRDCASFNEFIPLYLAQTACGYTISPVSALSWPTWTTTTVCITSYNHAALDSLLLEPLFLWLEVLYLWAVNSALPSASAFNYLTLVSSASGCFLTSGGMTLLFAQLLIHKRALCG